MRSENLYWFFPQIAIFSAISLVRVPKLAVSYPGFSTAVGLFDSIVSFVLVVVNAFSCKLSETNVF